MDDDDPHKIEPSDAGQVAGERESIYPPPLEFGSASDYPDPVHFGKDWRLLAPRDSAPYQAALKDPKGDDDEGFHQVLQILFESFPDAE